ncbi:hypothetical protein [Streptomyces sp. NPDC054940]
MPRFRASASLRRLIGDTALQRRLWSLVDEEEQDDAVRRELANLLALVEEVAKYDHQGRDGSIAATLRQQGLLEEALVLYQEEADAGRRNVAAHVAALHEQLGRPSEAATWYQRAADADERNVYALRQTARLMTAAVGRTRPLPG